MTIGGEIVLAAIGAILTFAVEFEIAGFNIRIAGIILMLAGLVVVVFGLINSQRRGIRTTTTTADVPVTEVSRERVVERDPDAF